MSGNNSRQIDKELRTKQVRIDKRLHFKLKVEAANKKITIRQLIEEACQWQRTDKP